MQKRRILPATAAWWGGFTSLGVTALAFLGNHAAGLPYAPYDLFDWLARVLPGPLVVFGVESIIKLTHLLNAGPTATAAKQAEGVLAITIFTLIGTGFGLFLARFGGHDPGRLIRIGAAGGLILCLLFIIVKFLLGFSQAGLIPSLIWLAALFAGWGAVLGRLLRDSLSPPPTAESLPTQLPTEQVGAPPAPVTGSPGRMSRRTFLNLVIAGVATLVLSALRINQQPANESSPPYPAGPTATPEPAFGSSITSGPAASPSQQELVARFLPVTGTRPELTPAKEFYRVDINLTPPAVDPKTWQLKIDGLVNHPLSLTLDELLKRPAFTQAITLECISNSVGGDLISTGLWTGLRLKDLMQEAGIRPEAQALAVEAVDGFYESISRTDMEDDRTLLVYAMDGEPLAVEHGYPLRVYIANRHGMKLPKWITHIEAVPTEAPGYWVDRGWNKKAIPHTTSAIDAVDVDQAGASGQVPVGGIAFSGDRGISKVEIQVDDGAWTQAELRTPPLSPLTWVQWRYFWKSSRGNHIIRVRAYDGAGGGQEASPHDTFPDGATGIDERSVLVL